MKYGRSEKDVPEINVSDTALIFEGGGMRASYTSGVVGALIENNINFAKVYGISAGSSNAANYISRDVPRAYYSFTGFVAEDRAVNKLGILTGKGYFNSEYLYEDAARENIGKGTTIEFDWDMFSANPADIHIEAFDRDSGETKAFTKSDMPELDDLMFQVRASSTMPIFMPPTEYKGRTYMDGGLGSSWGILLDAAKRDGYEKFFIVRTQEKGYRKKPISGLAQQMFRRAFAKYPKVAEATIERWHNYNDVCDEIERLEASGAAYVFYPHKMEVTNKTIDLEKLRKSLKAGVAQANSEVETWRKWLNL